MSIASEITRLQGVKSDILDAIAAKGVSVPSGAKLADCPELISLIRGGTADIGGRTYRTVTINGVTWLAENLDFKFSGLAIGQGTSSSEPRANYYQNNEATYGVNGNKYGLLYNWIAVKYLEDHKSELIPGGHVPTTTEWDALATAVGGPGVAGTKLKSTTGWSSGNGDGSYGFAAFPAGDQYSDSFYNLGNGAYFWTATENSSSKAYYRGFNTGASMTSYYYDKSYGCSVRLVKDSQSA